MAKTETAEKTEDMCPQRDCPMNNGGHCTSYLGYKWDFFGTKECKEQNDVVLFWEKK